jgi:putative flippase GtrA
MIKKVYSLFSSKEFIKFVVVGGFAAMVNFGSRIFYNEYIDFSNAVILAYCSGMLTAYVLSKLFVFSSSQHHAIKEMLYFILVNIIAVIQTWGVSMFLFLYGLGWVNIDLYQREIAHVIGILVPVFSSYLGHKYFTFKSVGIG